MTASEHTHATALPQPNRFITTHDAKSNAIFSRQIPESVSFWRVGSQAEPAAFGLAYTTLSTPIRLTEDEDLSDFIHAHEHRKRSGLVKKGGSVLRYVDYSPRSSSPIHRTVSCDYAIVLVGEMACLLDSGESRILKVGDVLIQRGTMHQWINNSDQWARMLYVLIDATSVNVDGEVFGEELGGMKGVPSSSL
ncbi:cupin domain containing [Fusarium albosuccineum]|uniref:Cupin domain containing n=1 Tax=Fusarium albosuccineum TaxID=1237068 RepID=A0A8H4KXS6_9HYPO|nr:cupin domain containing [Fusarium albosuccineum]